MDLYLKSGGSKPPPYEIAGQARNDSVNLR